MGQGERIMFVCPVCHREHHAQTRVCYKCKNAGEYYDLIFETVEQTNDYNYLTQKIRAEEKKLRKKGFSPNEISAHQADKLLKRKIRKSKNEDTANQIPDRKNRKTRQTARNPGSKGVDNSPAGL